MDKRRSELREMSICQMREMVNPKHEREARGQRAILKSYSTLYFSIGIVELKLRNAIPAALSISTKKYQQGDWFENLPLTPKGEIALHKALQHSFRRRTPGSKQFPEDFLPLSFWRYLIRTSTYTELWIPSLRHAFPNLRNAKEFSTFKDLESDFHTLLKARNRIAHYEINSSQELSLAKECIEKFQSYL